MDEDGVGRNDHVARLRTLRCVPPECEDEAPGADHDVAVDGEGALQFGGIEHLRSLEAQAARLDLASDHREAEQGGRDLGDERAEPDAVRRHVEAEHEHGVEDHVHDVEENLQQEGDAGPALADEPAEEHEVREREGRRPDADPEVG